MFGPLTATLSFTAAAPLSSTWAAFATVARWPEVLPDLASAHVEPDNVLVPGAAIRTLAKPDRNIIDMIFWVAAVEPERLLAIWSEAQGYRAETRYEFIPSTGAERDAATEVIASTKITPGKFRGRLISVLWRKKVLEQIERALRRRTGALIELAEKIAAEERSAG
jgi:hypothetical protein